MRSGQPDGNNNPVTGAVNVYGTASIGLLEVGHVDAATGTFNVYDGGLVTAGLYDVCTIGSVTGGTGTVNVYGGQMDITSEYLDIFPTGLINIEGGKLRVLGDRVTELQNYINDVDIIAYGGDGTVSDPNMGTGDDAGWTILTAIPNPETCVGQGVYYPGDINQDCYVNLDDLAILAQNWLLCNDPEDLECIQ